MVNDIEVIFSVILNKKPTANVSQFKVKGLFLGEEHKVIHCTYVFEFFWWGGGVAKRKLNIVNHFSVVIAFNFFSFFFCPSHMHKQLYIQCVILTTYPVVFSVYIKSLVCKPLL